MTSCPCGSTQSFSSCCEPFITRASYPQTPETLMRSRYTAYTLAKLRYIVDTQRGVAEMDFDRASAKRWAKSVTWLGLTVHRAWCESDDVGFVEFTARFTQNDQAQSLHELSEFQRIDQRWYYVAASEDSLPTSN